MFDKRLRELREEKNLTQSEVAKQFGISARAVSNYETGTREPPIDMQIKMANFFNVTLDFLVGRSSLRNYNTTYTSNDIEEIPILGVVRAGEPLYAEQNILGYYKIDKNLIKSGEHFYLKVTGDSMDLSGIKDDSLVLIRVQKEVENGEIALVLVDGEDATIKKFYRNGDIVSLMPHSSNPIYQQRLIDLKKDSVKVIGKVTGTFISF